MNVDTSPFGPLSTLGIVGNPSKINGAPTIFWGGEFSHFLSEKNDFDKYKGLL